MQTQVVLKTIKWIDSLFDPEVKQLVLEGKVLHGPEPGAEFVEQFIAATQELAVARMTLIRNSDAVEVLKAFDLELILERAFSRQLAGFTVGKEGLDGLRGILLPVAQSWRRMTECVLPLETLTLPEELREEKLPPGMLSLDMRCVEGQRPTLEDLTEASRLLQELYSAVARVYGKKKEEHLTIVKVESGCSVRIDTKGLGDVVKHLKDFFIEVWYKFRHKRAEEIITNNRAAGSSLALLDEIAIRLENGTLGKEEAEQLRRKVLDSTLGLFKRGALLTDIPTQETVDNTRLLGSFSPKLLPAPEKVPSTKPTKAPKHRKRPRKRGKGKRNK